MARLLEPGLVSYRDQGCGESLVTKETLDRCVHTFVGRPVVLRTNAKGKRVHPRSNAELNPQNMKEDGCGYISEVYYNASDGWWYGKGVVDTDEAVAALQDPQGCSVGYDVLRSGTGGKWHDIPYHDEIQDFLGMHLAIVDNPRYEAATIRLNAKQPKNEMSMFKWFKKAAPGATVSADPAAPVAAVVAAPAAAVTTPPVEVQNAAGDRISGESTFDIPGSEGKTETVTLAQLIADRKELQNSKAEGQEMGGEDEIRRDGKTYKVNALIEAFDIWSKEKTNAAEAEEKAKKEKADKEAAEKQNATKPDHFQVLLSARDNAPVVTVKQDFDTLAERLARGTAEFGSVKK